MGFSRQKCWRWVPSPSPFSLCRGREMYVFMMLMAARLCTVVKTNPLEMQNRKIFIVYKLYPKTYSKKDTGCWKFSSFQWLGLCAFVACKLCSTVQKKGTICWDQWMKANEGQSAIPSQNCLLITKGKIVIFQCILSDTFLTKYSKLIASDGVSKLPATMP